MENRKQSHNAYGTKRMITEKEKVLLNLGWMAVEIRQAKERLNHLEDLRFKIALSVEDGGAI